MMSKEAMKLALEALESCGAGHISDGGNQWHDEKLVDKAITALREALAEQPARPYRLLQDNGSKYFGDSWDKAEQPAQPEQNATMQSLKDLKRSVCDAVGAKALAQPAQQEPVAIEYWLQDTMESGRWVTTDNMAKATAKKMLSGEYGDVYPQGRIVEPSPPASKPLTDEQIAEIAAQGHQRWLEFARAIEAAHGIKEST